MPSIAYTAIASVFFVVILITWRVLPVARGRAKPGESDRQRLNKWNVYLLKLIRKTIDGNIGVAYAGFVTRRSDSPASKKGGPVGNAQSIATWPLLPTLIPDVQFIALARPDQTPPKIEAIADAEALRGLLGGAVRDQSMWGHQAWLYSWPPDLDMDELVRQLIPVEEFQAQYGRMDESQEDNEV